MLVVDDEAFVVTAIANILSLWGLDVITATSGDDAVTALKGRAPDLALLDYRLRGETGLDVLGKIERAFGRPIPAYLLTGDTAPGLLAEVSQRGTKILHKPIDHAQLIDAVRQSLANAPF